MDSVPHTIIHIPHASVVVPEHIRPTLCLTDEELQHELLVMTDWYTDTLFTLPKDAATTVVFPVSRLVVDPERFTDDDTEPMSCKGMGVVYTKASHGEPLRHHLSQDERERLLKDYYVPHHHFLSTSVSNALEAHGKCLLIDAHSFSSKPLPHEPDQSSNRCDICLGTASFHSPLWLVERLKAKFESLGFVVELNRPFSGTLVPIGFYRSNRNVLSIMIEVKRSLYMDEATGLQLPDFGRFQSQLRRVLMDLAQSIQDTTI